MCWEKEMKVDKKRYWKSRGIRLRKLSRTKERMNVELNSKILSRWNEFRKCVAI